MRDEGRAEGGGKYQVIIIAGMVLRTPAPKVSVVWENRLPGIGVKRKRRKQCTAIWAAVTKYPLCQRAKERHCFCHQQDMECRGSGKRATSPILEGSHSPLLLLLSRMTMPDKSPALASIPSLQPYLELGKLKTNISRLLRRWEEQLYLASTITTFKQAYRKGQERPHLLNISQ